MLDIFYWSNYLLFARPTWSYIPVCGSDAERQGDECQQ